MAEARRVAHSGLVCLKLQVIFRKKATHYRALLRKMTYKDKASYDSGLVFKEACHVHIQFLIAVAQDSFRCVSFLSPQMSPVVCG